jgi:carbamoyl-phosphate synthase large subunit
LARPSSNTVNVLFTSVGRRVELLRAFRRAYGSLGLGGQILAADVDPLAPGLRAADRPAPVPPLRSPEYVPALVDLCRREQVDLIFPLIDPDVQLLAGHREALEATGARLAAVSPAAAELTADKWQTVAFFRRLGLRVPRSWLPGHLDPSDVPYPLFIKPRQGSASKHTFPVRDARELAFFSGYVPDPIVQECLPGPEITTDVVCDPDGNLLGLVSRRRIEVRCGEVAKGVTVSDKAITEACVKIATALPAIGPVTVQCLMKGSTPYFTEINARFGGGIPLGVAAGVDSPRWLLAWAAGRAVDIPPVGTYRTGLYLTRFDESLFLTEAERGDMASRRL